jgi:hypothetical protein
MLRSPLLAELWLPEEAAQTAGRRLSSTTGEALVMTVGP